MQIETVSGRLVDPSAPLPEDIDIQDIAWGLSRIARFAGHTITTIPYNVAQHSIYVAHLVDLIITDPSKFPGLGAWIPYNTWYIGNVHYESLVQLVNESYGGKPSYLLKALLHDASEVYTGDMPSPVKHIPELRPVFKKIEHGLMDAIYQKFNLATDVPGSGIAEGLINYADKLAQRIEAYQFMPSRGKHWEGLPDASLIMIQEFPAPMQALDSYSMFMQTFKTYSENYRKRAASDDGSFQ